MSTQVKAELNVKNWSLQVINDRGMVYHWFALQALSSCTLTILNKHLISAMHLPNLLIVAQNATSAIIGIIAAYTKASTIKQIHISHFQSLTIPTFLFAIMLFTSLKSLAHIPVSATVMSRNIAIIPVAIADAIFFNHHFTLKMMVGIAMVLTGSFIYAYTDSYYNYTGYMWLFINIVLFVALTLYEKCAISKIEQTPIGIALYKNTLSIPFVLMAAGVQDEFQHIGAVIHSIDNKLMMTAGLTGLIAFGISVSSTAVYQLTNPTTIIVFSNLTKIFTAFVGNIVYGHHLPLVTLLGLGMCCSGTFIYALDKVSKPKSGEHEDIEAQSPLKGSHRLVTWRGYTFILLLAMTFLIAAGYIYEVRPNNKLSQYLMVGSTRQQTVAICTLTESNQRWKSLNQTTIQTLLIPSMEKTVTEHDLSTWNVVLYLGIDEADVFWKQHVQALQTPEWLTVEAHFYKASSYESSFARLMLNAYNNHNVEYIVCVDDDAEFASSGWITQGVESLKTFRPVNFGVVLPTVEQQRDTDILTHEMVHRTHIDVLNKYYSKEISPMQIYNRTTSIYEPNRVKRLKDWNVKLHLKSQETM